VESPYRAGSLGQARRDRVRKGCLGGVQAERGQRMRLIQIMAMAARLKLARYCIRAGKWFAAMGERLYRF